jgi:protein-disulfide isomerase
MTEQRARTRTFFDVVLVVAAVVAAASVARTAWRPARADTVAGNDSTYVADWKEIAATGVRRGPVDASIVLIELADFECPACRSFAPTLKELQSEYPNHVAVVFHHWPLEYHRFAKLAARSAVCAGDQSRFWEMHDLLYAKQDSLGVKPWVEYANEAGVREGEYAQCMKHDAEAKAVALGREISERVGGRGTPTIIINGWRLHRLPTRDELRQRVKKLSGPTD